MSPSAGAASAVAAPAPAAAPATPSATPSTMIWIACSTVVAPSSRARPVPSIELGRTLCGSVGARERPVGQARGAPRTDLVLRKPHVEQTLEEGLPRPLHLDVEHRARWRRAERHGSRQAGRLGRRHLRAPHAAQWLREAQGLGPHLARGHDAERVGGSSRACGGAGRSSGREAHRAALDVWYIAGGAVCHVNLDARACAACAPARAARAQRTSYVVRI